MDPGNGAGSGWVPFHGAMFFLALCTYFLRSIGAFQICHSCKPPLAVCHISCNEGIFWGIGIGILQGQAVPARPSPSCSRRFHGRSERTAQGLAKALDGIGKLGKKTSKCLTNAFDMNIEIYGGEGSDGDFSLLSDGNHAKFDMPCWAFPGMPI